MNKIIPSTQFSHAFLDVFCTSYLYYCRCESTGESHLTYFMLLHYLRRKLITLCKVYCKVYQNLILLNCVPLWSKVVLKFCSVYVRRLMALQISAGCGTRLNSVKPTLSTTTSKPSVTSGIYWRPNSQSRWRAVWYFLDWTTATLCCTELQQAVFRSCSACRTLQHRSSSKHRDGRMLSHY